MAATQKRFIAKNGLDNNSQTLTNVADPVNAQDVATRAYVLANAGGASTPAQFQRTVTVVSPTNGQTVFNIVYLVGYIDVFLNGIKLVIDNDFTAGNGTSVSLAVGALVGDSLELVVLTSVVIPNGETFNPFLLMGV